MNGRTLRFVLSAGCLWAGPAVAKAFDYPATIFLFSTPGTQAGPFELAVFPPSDVSFVAPDGTVFPMFGLTLVGLSQGDLVARFAGQWTVNDSKNVPGGLTQQHQFVVPGSALTGEFASVPAIISPAEGASVPRVFSVEWDDDDPDRSTFGLSGVGTQASPTRLADDHYQYSIAFAPGETLKMASFTAWGTRSTDLPEATPLVANPVNDWSPRVLRRTPSLPRTFTIQNVPEPSSWALVCMSAMAGAGMLQRKR